MSKETLKILADNLIFNLPKSFKMFKKNFTVSADIHNKITTLYIIREHTNINMTTLSQHSGIRKPNMTSTINDLVKEGYVLRVNDENDRRIIYLKLTEEGKLYLESKFLLLEEKTIDLLSSLSEDDQNILNESVYNIINLLKKVDKDTDK